MAIILGIDVGGSTTKIVGFIQDGSKCIGELQVKAADQVTSMFGAIGNFLQEYGIPLTDVNGIVLTGVGASFFNEDIYGIRTVKIDEFIAIGYGGLYLADIDEAYVISMGTGTAFVRASGEGITHIGGSGVGGGTLIGLSSIIYNKRDIDAIISLAQTGAAGNVDLLVKDILNEKIPSLPDNLTAANFGNVKSTATDADHAIGIINLIIQTVGMLAAFASKNDTIKKFVVTGSLTVLPQAKTIFDAIGDMHGISFVIPDKAIFATAIGATLSHIGSDYKRRI